MKWGRIVAGLVALAVVVGAVLAFRAGLPDVRRTVAAAGLWAPVLFVLLQGVVAATPVPRTVFTVTAGVLFGSVAGVALALVGTTVAAVVAFYLVRLVGGRFARRYADHAAMAWVRERLDRNGLLAMVSLRLIPLVPFSVANYGMSLSGARLAPYVVATVLGVLPGTVTVVVLGDAAVGGAPHPAMLAVTVVSGLLGLAGSLVVARRTAVPAGVPEEGVAA